MSRTSKKLVGKKSEDEQEVLAVKHARIPRWKERRDERRKREKRGESIEKEKKKRAWKETKERKKKGTTRGARKKKGM